MNRPLKVMILEDLKTDQELIKRQILKHNPNSVFTIARDKSGFHEKIDWFLPDLVLAEYNLVDFTGLEALVHIKEKKPFIPLIFVTGELNPKSPIEKAILKVADDFVLKDDIKTLYCHVKKIMDINAEKVNKFARALTKQNNQKIKILKTISLLENSGNFSGKEELTSILKSLEADLQEEE